MACVRIISGRPIRRRSLPNSPTYGELHETRQEHRTPHGLTHLSQSLQAGSMVAEFQLHTDVAAYVKGIAVSGVFRIQSEQSEMSSIRATFLGYLLQQVV